MISMFSVAEVACSMPKPAKQSKKSGSTGSLIGTLRGTQRQDRTSPNVSV